MVRCNIIFFLLMIIFCLEHVEAAAWAQKEGGGQVIVGIGMYNSNQFYDEHGELVGSNVNFGKNEIDTFFEYGWSDELTVGMDFSLQSMTFRNSANVANVLDFRQCGFSLLNRASAFDVMLMQGDIFLRRVLFEKNAYILSVQKKVRFPCLGIEDGNMQFVDDSSSFELRLLGGYGFEWDPSFRLGDVKRPFAGQYHFVGAELGYNKTHSRLSDHVSWDGVVGVRIMPELLLMAQVFSIWGVGNASDRQSFDLEKEDFFRVNGQLSMVRQITNNMSIQLSVFDDVLGKNVSKVGGVRMSLWYGF